MLDKLLEQAKAHLNPKNPKLVTLALAFGRKALAIDPQNLQAHCIMARASHKMANQADAEQWIDRALAHAPNNIALQFERAILQLPQISRDVAQTKRGIARYTHFLNDLIGFVDLNNPQMVSETVQALGQYYPFHLSYLKINIRDLQALYGRFVCRVMAAHWPHWATAPIVPPITADQPIRIGIPYGHFRVQSQWFVILKGWLAALDKDRFEITGYHLSKRSDTETDFARHHCHHFVEGERSLEEWAAKISSDQQHILIYPDTKMNLKSLRLAALRLAPVQMAAWGQVYTTGLPSIDYFLSSDLMEPSGADAHYTEQLLRLPNLSIHYLPDETPQELPLPRSHFNNLRDDAVLYACSQSLWKYQPQHDFLFAHIAARLVAANIDCQFVFLQHKRSEALTQLFRNRLRQAFAAQQLDADQHIVTLPYLTRHEYQSLGQLADVYLDTPEWCGMATTMELLHYATPIVTLAGQQFRGRTGHAILTHIDVPQTIAPDLPAYIDIAAKLGMNAEWRTDICTQMQQNAPRAYRDPAPIKGLETFLTQAVA
ncbi:MAG: hypothetical protein ACPG8W_15330 [Candidatus Promineifilaceae bacterium]